MKTRTISEWIHDVHQTAVEKGWFEEERQRLELHMLMITEISEATEEIRKHKPSFYIENGKPEGEAIELADVVLRIFDYAGYKKVDLVKFLKMEHQNYIKNSHNHSKTPTNDNFEDLTELTNKFSSDSKNTEWYKTYSSFENTLEKHMLFTITISKASQYAIQRNYDSEYLYLTRALIQILVYFKDNNWDINEILDAKHSFNMARAYKHGGKKC